MHSPRTGLSRRLPLVAGSVTLLLALAAVARAGEILEVFPGPDRLQGTVGAETDLFPFRAIADSSLTLVVKAPKGSDLVPDVEILGSDGMPIDGVDALKKANKSGSKLKVKNVALPATGTYFLALRSKDGTQGAYDVKSKIKAPKKLTLAGEIPVAGGEDVILVPSTGDALLNLSVAADRKWSDGAGAGNLQPGPGEMLAPSGDTDEVTNAKLKSGKFKASKVPFPEFGDYRLTILADPGTRGGFTAKVSGLKYAKRAKRTVFDTDILLPPIVRSVEPSEALLQDTVEDLTIHGSFFQPAPKVRFSRLGETVGITGAVTVDESTIILDLDVGKLRPGTWDVTVENTDGGSGVLKSAFTVLNVAAKDLGMTPNVATNGEVVEAVITGEDLQEGLALQLVQGAETILGRNTDRVSSQLVTTEFDLNGRPMGNWDLHVTNPGAAAAVLPVALVVEKASPQVTSVTPATVHDTGSPFTIEIFGNYFDTGASVELARAGESSVPADSATATSATRIVATLDTAGRDVGLWDVVVRNPDGKTGTLADGLEVKFAMRVLLLSDNGAEGPIKTALTAAGMLVTDAGLYSKWDPASGALDKIDVVVWPQGAAWGSAPTDNADKALEAFVKNGGGLIRTEWGAYDIATLGTGPTRLHSMMPVTAPGGNYAYGSNWTVTDTSHEMVQGLPTAWSESAAGYSQVTVDSHAKVVIQNSLGYAILTYRTDSGGTFIHLNHSMTENNVTISDNVLKLIVNMVKFASPR